MEHMRNVATPSAYVCPDCRGALWEVSGSRPSRFRCHTGHAYTLRTLYDAQFAQTDEALWGAVRALQEQELVLQRLAEEGPADAGQAARQVQGGQGQGHAKRLGSVSGTAAASTSITS